MAMRVLISGSSGLVGSSLMRHLEKDSILRIPKYEVFGFDEHELDVTKYSGCLKIICKDIKPDLVIHCAAYTSVDGAEDNIDQTFIVNGVGTENIAKCCYHFNIPMLYFSTDSVFDGTKRTPYLPSDKTNPLSVYAKSKLLGELAVQKYLNKFYIIRTIWIYGTSRSNFITQAITKLKELKNEIVDFPIVEQRATPTNVDDLCDAVKDLIETNKWGIYHFTNSGIASRSEVISFLAQMYNKIPKFSEYKNAKAIRPKYSIMDLEKIE